MQLGARVQTSIELLNIFFESGAPFDIVMSKFFKRNKWIGAQDRRAIAEFSYEIFRNFEKLKLVTTKITANWARFFVLSFLRLGKNMSLDEIKGICNSKQYCPARLSEFEEKFLSNIAWPSSMPDHCIYNYPEWMQPYISRVFGGNMDEMLALNDRAHVDLRVNSLKTTREQAKEMLSQSGVITQETPWSDIGLRVLQGRVSRGNDVYVKGIVEIQDEGSQLVALLCDAQPGDTVIDYCAGAGGKTLAIAAQMQNKGRIFALDKYVERLENAKLRLRRAGVSNVFCQEITSKWVKRHAECADVVLVDAPCSGTGTWRRNPDMRAKFQESDLQELITVQTEILEKASKLVKPGGRLVYATCSILMEENEDQVQKFLQNHPEFEALPVAIKTYSGQHLRLSPKQHDTDGFFAAVMHKQQK